MVALLAKVAIPFLVLLTFALARRYMPVSRTEILDGEASALSELDAQLKPTQWVFGAGMMAVGIAIFFALHSLLVTINLHLAAMDGPGQFLLLPQTAIWYFLPGFAALATSWDATLFLWRLLGDKRQASLYEHWTNAKAGFNTTRVLRLATLVIVLPIAFLTGLALPEHDTLGEADIRSHG